MPELLDDDRLERTAVVANSEMNRERRLAAYREELGFDPVAWLAARAPARWLDVGCGGGHALSEAAGALSGRVEIIGMDLLDRFAVPASAGLELHTGSVVRWAPDAPVDLVTAVHSLHYVGDKLAALTRMSSWLTEGGQLAANFDASAIRWADGTPIGQGFIAALRHNGFRYNARTNRISRTGRGAPEWEFRYLGADDHAGPNYTGQDAVASYYGR